MSSAPGCSSPTPRTGASVALAHGEVFAESRPAATCVVTSLLDPSWKVEIEAEAVIASIGKQLIPPDITGKGCSGRPASRASVLDHAFGKSDPYTLGVEEEYQLLDGTSFDLVQHIDTVLAAIEGHELEPQINPELMQSVLEIATPVCHTPADVMRELVKLRGYVCEVARDEGAPRRLGGHASRSASSSASASRRRTATASSSTSCSTSRAASSSSGCTSTSRSTIPRRRSR